jgi:hypothetical protein
LRLGLGQTGLHWEIGRREKKRRAVIAFDVGIIGHWSRGPERGWKIEDEIPAAKAPFRASGQAAGRRIRSVTIILETIIAPLGGFF